MTVSRSQRTRTAVPIGSLLAAMLVVVVAPGCKTGTAAAKPSWWAFGGSDSAKLASAPAYEKGDIKKPSATATPYPVTATPQPYSLSAATQAAASGAAAGDVAATPPVVTYGSTPPSRPQPGGAAAAVPDAPPSSAGRQPPPLASIAPQVGPYSSLPGEPPAAANPAADLGGDGSRASLPDRFADNRSSEAWAGAAAPPPAGARYGNVSGSRFGAARSTVEIPDQPPQLPARPVGFATPDSPPGNGTLQAAPAGSLPGTVEPASPPAALNPATFPPTSAPPVPTRRPDPMYRPAGTSSYRPGREILVGSGADADSTVRQVNFEAQPSGR